MEEGLQRGWFHTVTLCLEGSENGRKGRMVTAAATGSGAVAVAFMAT